VLSVRVVLYVVLVLLNVAAVAAWVASVRRGRCQGRPTLPDGVIGCVTSFLDTLGIGSYAQITALCKLRGRPADELIPGTLNVGSAVPVLISSLFYLGAVAVDPTLLTSMVVSAGAGAWVGANLVSRMPRRMIQLVMGVALLIAAGFFATTALGVLPPMGAAFALAGWRFAVAVGANFLLGALMCIGIGNYAPSMVLLGVLGMHPLAAYPIMIGSDGVLIPVAALGFLGSGRFAPGCALGITLGGILGVLAALPVVRLIAGHLNLMRWFVVMVVVYAALSMLRSARSTSQG
jgi:Sulfite exporter TauE/SafE